MSSLLELLSNEEEEEGRLSKTAATKYFRMFSGYLLYNNLEGMSD